MYLLTPLCYAGCVVLCCHASLAFPLLPPTPPHMTHTQTQPRPTIQTDYNFDHPDAFDHQGLLQCLKDLKVSWGQLVAVVVAVGGVTVTQTEQLGGRMRYCVRLAEPKLYRHSWLLCRGLS